MLVFGVGLGWSWGGSRAPGVVPSFQRVCCGCGRRARACSLLYTLPRPQSEIRDIILGAEITPPSQQRQQIAEIEKQARAAAGAGRECSRRGRAG